MSKHMVLAVNTAVSKYYSRETCKELVLLHYLTGAQTKREK